MTSMGTISLIWMLVCILAQSNVDAAPTTEMYTKQAATMDFLSSAFPYLEPECDTCCETREHGYLIVKAEVIQSECPSSSFMPSSSTFMPTVVSTNVSSSLESSTMSSSNSSPATSPVTVSVTTSPSSPTTSVTLSPSTRDSSKLSTVLSSSSIRPPQPSTSSHSTFYPSSMFPSSAGPSSTLPPDFSCDIGEICCETRTIGHIVVLAEVIGDEDELRSTPSYNPSTSS